ncbi:MAG: peptide chain release factor N(5)-glutamine methyltransferase [Gammaproteobacteria bacterium]|nr:MAG: peptide chain release factor N(5)-glutamine methyltransferase [Gammaproteobacteria bacterium]
MRLDYRQALERARTRLGGPQGRLEAELLLAHVLQRPRSHVLAWPEAVLDGEAAARFERLVERRAAGVPMAYLLGEREFWSLRLEVTPDTLIPRPETELLVERALVHLPADHDLRVVDAGTGSGAIALALAHERPRAFVLGVDRCPRALAVAARNRDRLGLVNARFLQGDWLTALRPECLDLVAANPPYVAARDPHLTQGDPAWEPRSALVAGDDGLAALRRLLPQAAACLRPGGWLLVEHGWDQAAAVAELLHRAGLGCVRLHHDLAGRPRVTEARRP